MRLKRAGFTLVELLVAAAIAGVVVAAIASTLVRQQHFYSAAANRLDIRSQLRDGAEVLVADIRSASVAKFGMSSLSDSSLEMFTIIGTSIACAAPTGRIVGLAPSVMTTGHTLTSLLVQPDTGDIAAVYEIPSGVPDSGHWVPYRIAAFGAKVASLACPATTGFVAAADASSAAYSLTLAATPAVAFRKGAPIHFIRRVRYSLYRSSDNAWYLGYRRCNATPPGCTAIQPVSGPYRAYANGDGSGLSFRYFDAAGASISSTASTTVARVEIVLRGQSDQPASLVGDALDRYRDSTVVSVSPRNR